MAGGGTTLKTLGVFAVLVAGVIFVNYGTLSPCDALRETVRRQDGLATALLWVVHLKARVRPVPKTEQ